MEHIPDSAVGFLLNNLKDFIVYNVGLIGNVDDENVDGLRGDIEELEAFVKEYTKTTSDNGYLEVLVNQIRDAVYGAEDIIEKYIVYSATNWFPRIGLLKRRKLGKALENIRTELLSIKKYTVPAANEERRAEQTVNAGGKKTKIQIGVPNDVVVGFEDETEKVIELLRGESKQLEVISITGMVGCGKTTLAKKVYNDRVIEHEFLLRAFVNVGQQYDRKQVFLKILGALGVNTAEKLNLQDELIAQEIHEILKDAKYLIVVDDVWTKKAWDDLSVAFPGNDMQSRVLLTTRDNNVATHANPSKEHHHPVRPLSPEESHELLQRKVFGTNSCLKGVENHKNLIVKKCRGLPLAIVVIAGILRSKRDRIDWWESVAESVSDNIARMDESKELIQMSFNHLPYHLKHGFLYLGLFPEDFEIPVWTLLRLWVAEGFIEGSAADNLEDTAELYLDELINRNLVIVERRRLNGHIKTCSVHDALREFCRKEGERQKLFQEIKEFDPATRLPSKGFRRICINSNVSGYVASNPSGKNIRSFLGFAKEQSTLEAKQVRPILAAFKFLRILDVRSIRFKGVSSQFYCLVILKYMAVSCDWHTLPEDFSKLWNLQTLIVETSHRTLAIKANIWKLARLRHIHTNASASLQGGGEATTDKSNLQTLSTISPESCTRAMFEKTPKLTKLGICGKLVTCMEPESGPSLFDNLVRLECLENLKLLNSADLADKLHFLPDHNKFPSQVTRLTLSNTHLKWEHMSTLGQLNKLVVLKLKKKAFIGRSWKTEDKGFPLLKVLQIEEADLNCWEAKESSFQELTSLILKHCKDLRAIPLELAGIPSLQRIDLHWTPAVGSAREIEKRKETTSSRFKLDVYPPAENDQQASGSMAAS